MIRRLLCLFGAHIWLPTSAPSDKAQFIEYVCTSCGRHTYYRRGPE